MEYKIEKMRSTEAGYQVATVTSFYDQKTYILHNRYGAWFIGDPDEEHSVMRAPETISQSLPFDLQAYKNGSKGRNVEAAPPKPNVFMKKAERPNSFVAKAQAKMNPFVAKASATKPNPFIAKAKR